MVLVLFGGYSLANIDYNKTGTFSNGKSQQHRTPQELLTQSSGKQKMTGVEIAFLIFFILYLVFWLMMVISAFTSTANRNASEKIFSVFEALLLPEVWLFQHGINASQQNTAFFSAMPPIHQKM